MICPKQICRFRTGNLLLYKFLKYMALRDRVFFVFPSDDDDDDENAGYRRHYEK
jgi:hypothetical protein